MSKPSEKTYKVVKKWNNTKRLEGIIDAANANNSPTAYKPQYTEVETIPSTNNILHDILQTVAYQTERWKIKSAQGYGLEPEELRALKDCNDIVMKIKADERAELSQADLRAKVDSMTDQQLLDYAEEVLNKTEKAAPKDGK
jgi:hypothetical protein